jgi:hypothetical protein
MIEAAFYHQALGTIPGWLTLLALAVLGFYVVRGAGGQALDVLERANRVLTDELARRDAKEAEQAKLITELRASRSLEVIVERIASEFGEQRQRQDERDAIVRAELLRHESNSQDRHDAQLAATQQVGDHVAEVLERALHNGGGH